MRLIGVAIVVAVVATCGLWFGRLLFDSQWTLTLHELLQNTGVENPPVTGPRDITHTACGEALNCVEAYDTAEATYYRSSSPGPVGSVACSNPSPEGQTTESRR